MQLPLQLPLHEQWHVHCIANYGKWANQGPTA
jgi:hypothetical protein